MLWLTETYPLDIVMGLFPVTKRLQSPWLVERGVRLVGIDYLSVAPFDESAPTHLILLHASVIALEGLNLSGIAPGLYQLVCLPLKIAGSDGAPAREILIDQKDKQTEKTQRLWR